ncbi:MBL fold metallo-hydrolase [candidate division CSSED10-310 bacterium]|uniref:MBL fold metallo-hydrolase n=1 Tax=candidate division CSSED10-310 bacterium TaxID=2855610 RepID=A0ABV6Z0Q4_UNCC1
MQNQIETLEVGQFKLTIMCDSHLLLPVKWAFHGIKQQHWSSAVELSSANSFRCPVNVIHCEAGPHSVIIDTGIGEPHPTRKIYDAEFSLQQVVDLKTNLSQAGIEIAAVTAVIFSHSDWDHIMGATVEGQGERQPFFPQARHFIMNGGWEHDEVTGAVDSVANIHLSVLKKHGQLQLLDKMHTVAPGITMIPSPGHAAEHAHVRLSSNQETLFCSGDLFHHPIMITHPDWIPYGNDRENLLTSRQAVIAEALDLNAYLFGAHFPFPGIGKLVKEHDLVKWVPTIIGHC